MDRNYGPVDTARHLAQSLSARRAWIEIFVLFKSCSIIGLVALRKESVDRNPGMSTISSTTALVALRKESVDRNSKINTGGSVKTEVALRKESVDRNADLVLYA